MHRAPRHRATATPHDNRYFKTRPTMPATNAGHGAALLNTAARPQIGQQHPPAAPTRRRKSTPPLPSLARSSRSNRPRTAPPPACRRQIPIDRKSRTAAPDPPAVSSPEPCPTPAALRKAPLPPRRGRCPTTLNKSRLGRGKIHYLPSRALWVHNVCSGSPASSRPIELNPYEAAPRRPRPLSKDRADPFQEGRRLLGVDPVAASEMLSISAFGKRPRMRAWWASRT